MKKIFVIMLLGTIAVGCGPSSNTGPATPPAGGTADQTEKPKKNKPFPDFGYMVNKYQGPAPVFVLSQDYPETLPTPPLPSFFQIDYQKDWRKYLLEVQKYCFEGNTDVDFVVQKNMARKWYHMPWQHYGPAAREGFHGLTQEAPVQAYQLAPTQSIDTAGAVAVGFYNEIAGYTIGQVWKDHRKPNHSENVSFKNGAVLFKILFVTLPEKEAVQQAPFLTNGIWWDAFVCPNFHNAGDTNQMLYRKAIKVVLIQMDVMVRDDRAPNGWIFGNFQYNGKMNKANKWENLVPLGIMWGEDPKDTTNFSNPKPTKTIINPKLVETIINPDANELPPTHLGWNSRLNGPVDNPMSSCYSCHSTAEYKAKSPMSPLFVPDTLAANPPGSPGWMRWFENLKCGQPFDQGQHSMDFSLQLSQSIQFFYDWRKQQGGLYAKNYPIAAPAPAPAAGAKMMKAAAMPAPKAVRNAIAADTTEDGDIEYPIEFPGK